MFVFIVKQAGDNHEAAMLFYVKKYYQVTLARLCWKQNKTNKQKILTVLQFRDKLVKKYYVND